MAGNLRVGGVVAEGREEEVAQSHARRIPAGTVQ
jgi:hypothetical protein